MEANPAQKAMSSAQLSKHVTCVKDLYEVLQRNGF